MPKLTTPTFLVPKTGTVLKILDQFNTIEHETDGLLIKVSGIEKDIAFDTTKRMLFYHDTELKFSVEDTIIKSYVDNCPSSDGSQNLGTPEAQWNQALLMNSIKTPLCFEEVVDTDMSLPASHQVDLPGLDPVPTIEYKAWFSVNGGHVFASPLSVEIVYGSESDTKFDIDIRDRNGALLDCSADNVILNVFIVFKP